MTLTEEQKARIDAEARRRTFIPTVFVSLLIIPEYAVLMFSLVWASPLLFLGGLILLVAELFAARLVIRVVCARRVRDEMEVTI